ncbi:Helix-turn-helix domain-containing protein [Tenacibaculum sp. MAR_2009_124]|uniref:AraC family transcriptional regulator n=1 Tax=Tenacibaculum sp. MAR_2009_124 TaxID=1250059 RepID=UPI000894E5BD|nr:helix-turn-helix domain-containing protein [Tenacibaculum sp. MAR_2009_124]SEB98000.1 Helix-turn-helix domain-containing protein [Tenacibaculum sp. MAR_2009_124]
MKELNLIRNYYTPIQPSVKSISNVSYKEITPNPALKNYIHCFWYLKTKNRLNKPFSYRVVSDGCIDIFFNLNNTEENFIMGFCKGFKEFSIAYEFSYIGIRFYPSIFPFLFKTAAKNISDLDTSLSNITPEFSSFISLLRNNDLINTIKELEDYIFSIIKASKTSIDLRFFNAFIAILRANGNIATDSGLNTGLGPRQLRRLFNYYIGTTPKSFCLVVRFQYVLNQLLNSKTPKNHFFLDVGFYDQAHFIKNFTQFYGISPMKALL